MRLLLPFDDTWRIHDPGDGVLATRERPASAVYVAQLESVPVEPKHWRDRVSKKMLPPGTRFEGIKGAVLDGTPWSAGIMDAQVVDASGTPIEEQLQVFYQVLWFAAHVSFRCPAGTMSELRDGFLALARQADLDWVTEEVACLADVWAPGPEG